MRCRRSASLVIMPRRRTQRRCAISPAAPPPCLLPLRAAAAAAAAACAIIDDFYAPLSPILPPIFRSSRLRFAALIMRAAIIDTPLITPPFDTL